MRFTLSILCTLTIIVSSLNGQSFQPPASTAKLKMEGYEVRKKMISESPFRNIPYTNIGPTVFSGRVVDVEVNPEDPSIFYVAYASGGLWKTINNGTTFTPIFDNEAVMTIGDFDVHWDTGKIAVGTGEVNSSRSSYAGLGVYVSTNDGETWSNIGLENTHHIGKVIIDKENPDIILVAALGALYSENKERGVFKTLDGGSTWSKTLFIDNQTGVVDLDQDPIDSNILYASAWHRSRTAWDFIESGASSGIYKSMDGGDSWEKVTNGNGFPEGEGVGRIGTAVFNDGNQNIVYALLDNYFRRPADEEGEDGLTKEELRVMSKEEFLELDDKLIKDFLSDYRFPRKYTVESVKSQIKNDDFLPSALVEFTEDANSLLFDTPVIGAEVYKSTDGGKSWKKTHEDYIEFLYNSYGYYFGLIEVDPVNSETVYIGGVPVLKSYDGGQSWSNINGENVHSDHHALWINPKRVGHLILGNDGGINISYDDGENWIKCNAPSVGQYYYINIDFEDTYNVYGGLQDNGVWYGPNDYEPSVRWHSTGEYPYKSILGGDGMQVQIDNRDNNTVYTGLQFGNYYRINKTTRDRKFITPQHNLGERPYRWNWQTPILLSPHNQDILYMGSNFLHRSMDKGESFTKISEDLTNGGRKGDVPYGTLATISESPFQFGLIYTGSDDGVISVTKDGGANWNKISEELPQDMWVSRVIASEHKKERVIVSLNGYRWDDATPYLYLSEDYGSSWKRIGKDLPHESINVVKEDPSDSAILYVGTDHGTYISFDLGLTFHSFSAGVPAVPIHDLVIHPVKKEIILGTHGRSLYKASVDQIQQYNKIKNKDIHLFALENLRKSPRWGRKPNIYNQDPDPQYEFSIYSQKGGRVTVSILDEKDEVINKWDTNLPSGISFQDLNIQLDEKISSKYIKSKELEKAENGFYYIDSGKFILKVEDGKNSSEINFEIK